VPRLLRSCLGSWRLAESSLKLPQGRTRSSSRWT
jgi:hypothetical protein